MTQYLKDVKGISYRTFKNKPKHKRDKIRVEYIAYIEDNKQSCNIDTNKKPKKVNREMYQTEDYIVEIEENR